MKNKENKKLHKQMIYSLLAIGLFVLLLLVSYPLRKKQETRVKDIVVFGDSIMGECRGEESIPAKLEKLLGAATYNGALGGTRMSRIEKEKRLDQNRDGLSFAALSKAIATEDFGIQQMIHVRDGATGYFDETIDGLDEIDFHKVKIVIIAYGMNDYHNAQIMDNPKNREDEYTFKGALRSSITTLQNAYPKLRIILVTPTYSWYPSLGLTCEDYDTGNGYLEQYVEAEIELAKELGVECIDLYHDLYPASQYEDWQICTRDGLHPSEEGRVLIAERIAKYLRENK